MTLTGTGKLPVDIPDGSAASFGLRFAGDEHTGLWRDEDGTVRLVVDGETSIYVDVDGNVFVPNGALDVQGSSPAYTDQDQTWTAPQRIVPTTDNDGSFDLTANNNFVCTLSGNATLTINAVAGEVGQQGSILLDNTGGHTVTFDSALKAPTDLATDLTSAGVYWLSYWVIATDDIKLVASEALT